MIWCLLGMFGCGPSTPEEHEAAGDMAENADDREASYQVACNGGRIVACRKLAAMGSAAIEVRRKAAEVACEAGDADGCSLRTDAPGDRWSQRACELGRGSACLDSARVAESPRERARWLAQACHQAEVTACVPAAYAWRELGEATRSTALYGVGCDAGQPGACWLRERTKEEEVRREGCVAGDEGACEAQCIRDGRNCADVAEQLEASCRKGHAVACTRRGLVGADRGDPDAGDWLWLGCDRVDPWGCILLADRVEEGMALPAKARGDVGWLRNQACDLQLDYGCAKAP